MPTVVLSSVTGKGTVPVGGASGQVLVKASATDHDVGWVTRDVAPVRRVYTAGATWTKPVGLAYIEVEAVGGGGGGGGSAITTSTQAAAGGGGGGGGYAKKLLAAAILPASCAVAVGAAGAASAAGAFAGGAGGASTFSGTGITTVSATGGAGAAGSAAQTGRFLTPGADGGLPTGGDINVDGSDGGNGTVITGPHVAPPAAGGASAWGGGVRAPDVSANGLAGLQYGGGGSGSYNQSAQATGKAGGAGAAGVVVVTEY